MKAERRLSRPNRLVIGALFSAAVGLAGMCAYMGARSPISWREHDGVVVHRSVELPPKYGLLVRYSLTIRETPAQVATFDVPRDVYERARLGMHVHRDRFGRVTIGGQ
jgi:hypothetical protein